VRIRPSGTPDLQGKASSGGPPTPISSKGPVRKASQHMTTIDWIRRVAALGLVVTAGVPVVSLAQATPRVGAAPVVPGVGIAPVVPGAGIAPVVPGAGIAPVVPSPTAPAPYVSPPPILSPNAPIGGGFGGIGVGGFGVGGFGVGGFGVGGIGVGGFGYPGMYGGFGGPYGGFGMSLPPTPEFGFGAYRAGNQFPGPAAGMGMGAGVPAGPNAPPAGKAGPNAIGVPSEDPFDAAGVAGRPPSREVRSKRALTGRRPTARKPARQPSKKPEAKAPKAQPNRPEVNSLRDEVPAAPQEKPVDAAKADGAKPAARTRSMLGSPR